MKKTVVLLLTILLLMMSLSSCRPVNALVNYGSLKHEHIAGEWQYSGELHWRGVTCTWGKCDIDPSVENHVDDDNNDVCDICGSNHEHIFGQWYYGESYHWCTATCTWNGCDIDTTAEHYDEDNNHICDVCGYFDVVAPHTEHTGKWYAGEESHFYEYTCGCVNNDIAELHYDHDGDSVCDACGYLGVFYEKISLTQYEPWLGELTVDDVQEIITYSHDGWTSPELQTIISTTNRDVIGQLIDEYRRVVVLKNDLIDYDIPPGGFDIEFKLEDGSVKRIRFYGGGHFYGGHPVSKTPNLNRAEFIDVDIRYSLITYGGFEKIYSSSIVSSLSEVFLVARINPEMFEFKECECDPQNYPSETFSQTYYYFAVNGERIEIFGETYHMLYDGKVYDIVNSGRVDLSGIVKVRVAHEEKYNDGRTAFVEVYYGTFDSGAIVAMVSDDRTMYTEALWSEIVAGRTFNYVDGNRIVVLYDGVFYTLPEAYEKGYLTTEDIYAI